MGYGGRKEEGHRGNYSQFILQVYPSQEFVRKTSKTQKKKKVHNRERNIRLL